MNKLINIADIQNPQTGLTSRQENNARTHKYSIGTLVELSYETMAGARLFVVCHTRDCDGTPLYCLSADRSDTTKQNRGFANSNWLNGISEDIIEELGNTEASQ